MNDLNQLLRDAAGSDGGERLDPHDLLVRARRKVRNRRIVAVGAAAATLAVVAGVIAAVSDPRDKRADVVEDPDRGRYQQIRIAPSEVERRCSLLLGATETEWVAGIDRDGVAVPAESAGRPIEDREGHLVQLLPAGEDIGNVYLAPDRGPGWSGSAIPSYAGVRGECLIPQTGLIAGIATSRSEPVPPAADSEAVVDLCTRRNAYDLTGWQVVTTASSDTHLFAMLRSENDYYAVCSLGEDGSGSLDLEGVSRPGPEDRDGVRPHSSFGSCEIPPSGEGLCVAYGAGLSDGTRVTIDTPARRLATTEEVDGAFVVAVAVTSSTSGPVLRLNDRDGTVLEETALHETGGL